MTVRDGSNTQTEGFHFSFVRNTRLTSNAAGCFLVSETPLRTLRLNESLFSVLQQLRENGAFSDLIREHPGINKGQLLRTLLSLTAKGYLELEGIDPLSDYPNVSVIIPVRA